MWNGVKLITRLYIEMVNLEKRHKILPLEQNGTHAISCTHKSYDSYWTNMLRKSPLSFCIFVKKCCPLCKWFVQYIIFNILEDNFSEFHFDRLARNKLLCIIQLMFFFHARINIKIVLKTFVVLLSTSFLLVGEELSVISKFVDFIRSSWPTFNKAFKWFFFFRLLISMSYRYICSIVGYTEHKRHLPSFELLLALQILSISIGKILIFLCCL